MNQNKEVREKVAQYIRDHESETFQQIAATLGLAISTLSGIAKEFGLSRSRGGRLIINLPGYDKAEILAKQYGKTDTGLPD